MFGEKSPGPGIVWIATTAAYHAVINSLSRPNTIVHMQSRNTPEGQLLLSSTRIKQYNTYHSKYVELL